MALRLRARRPRVPERREERPTYRADVWVALEAAPHLSAAELARRTYASFATAWQVKQDFEILDGSRRKKGRGSVRKSHRSGEAGSAAVDQATAKKDEESATASAVSHRSPRNSVAASRTSHRRRP